MLHDMIMENLDIIVKHVQASTSVTIRKIKNPTRRKVIVPKAVEFTSFGKTKSRAPLYLIVQAQMMIMQICD